MLVVHYGGDLFVLGCLVCVIDCGFAWFWCGLLWLGLSCLRFSVVLLICLLYLCSGC